MLLRQSLVIVVILSALDGCIIPGGGTFYVEVYRGVHHERAYFMRDVRYSVKVPTFQTFYPEKFKGYTFQAFNSVKGSTFQTLFPKNLKCLHVRHFTL